MFQYRCISEEVFKIFYIKSDKVFKIPLPPMGLLAPRSEYSCPLSYVLQIFKSSSVLRIFNLVFLISCADMESKDSYLLEPNNISI
jgi:hypothetical protein